MIDDLSSAKVIALYIIILFWCFMLNISNSGVGCKNFYSMCSFGDKPLASKCIKCRQRSRRHYSMQKTACTTSSPSTAELTMHSPLGGLHIDTAIANDCDDCEEGPGSGTAQDSDRCTPPITKWRTQSDMPDIDAPANKVASRSRADTWAGRKADSSIRFSPHSPTKTLPELPPIVHALLSPTTALKGADAANDSLLMLSSVLKSELLSPVSVKLTPVTHVMHAPPLLKRKADGSLSLDGCIDSPVKHKKIELVFNQDSSFSSLAVEAETKMTSPNSSSRDVSAPTSTSISDQRWQWDASSNPLMYFATILAEAGSQ